MRVDRDVDGARDCGDGEGIEEVKGASDAFGGFVDDNGPRLRGGGGRGLCREHCGF